MVKHSTYDVIIAGAGLAGLSLAAALRPSGLRVCLLDSSPLAGAGGTGGAESSDTAPSNAASSNAGGWDTRIYALAPSSVRFLEALGAWEGVDSRRVTSVEMMEVAGDDLRASPLQFSAFDTGTQQLACILESRELTRGLLAALAPTPQDDGGADRAASSEAPDDASGQPWLRRLSGVSLTSIERSARGCRVELASQGETADGQALPAAGATLSLETTLLVGADGARSPTRLLAGLRARHTSYELTAVVANFSVELAHAGMAFQWFRDGAVLAWLPLGGRCISMVWSLPAARAEARLAAPEAALAAQVAAAGEYRLGEMRLMGMPGAYPLNRIRVDDLAADRVALIGDAAHTIHPLAGQGINLGFRDARDLAGLIGAAAKARSGTDCGAPALLRRYRQMRAEDILSLDLLTHGLQRLFAAPDPLSRALRNSGLNLLEHLPMVKGVLARRALA